MTVPAELAGEVFVQSALTSLFATHNFWHFTHSPVSVILLE
jgi:hypothetical protein